MWVVVGVFVLLLASLVIGALRRPAMPTGTVTTPSPGDVGDSLVGPAEYTLDATSPANWTWFDFSRNARVENPGALDWDLAVRRFHVIVNGGAGFAGRGGLVDLGPQPFDSVLVVPDTGYAPTDADSINPVTRRWYDYGYTSHLLQPKGSVYALRTADGKYAKLQVVSYYCGEALSGCLSFRYVYQGDGSRSVSNR